MCSGPNNAATSFIATDSEHFDLEDFDMSTYEDLYEQSKSFNRFIHWGFLGQNDGDGTTKGKRVILNLRFDQQQLEQNDDTTKSLHQKSGAGNTDPVTREGTRDSKPQSTENWCKQYAAEPRCQTNNYCIANNLCTNPTTYLG
jgi:large exoprotein involved in heme utilization and adhesion